MGRFFLFLKFAFFLSFFFVFSSPCFAVPIASISAYPKLTVAGKEFDVEVELSSLEVGSSYYLKSVGGADWRLVYTWSEKTSEWLAWNGSWSDMPEVSASTEGIGKITIISKFSDEAVAGLNPYKIRIRRVETTTNYDSPEVEIEVLPSPSPSPSPTPTIDPTPTPYTGGGISLNEFMPNPSEGEEWVEIKNENDFEVSLEDWSIDDIADGGSSPVEFSSTISAKGLFVVYIGTRLNNSGDTVRLIGQGGEEIETYPYASSRKGYSFAKDADGNWQETSDPTPGEENSIVGFSTPQPEAGRPLDGTPTPVPTATPTLEPDSVLGLSSKPSTSSANTATDSGYLVDLMCPLIEELETKFQIQKNDNLGQNTGGEEKKDINETRPHVRYVLLLGLAAAVGSFGSLLKETSFLVKWWHELFSKV